MDDSKKKKKPAACTQAPWEVFIKEDKYETSRRIKQESIELYGEDLNSCPKRKVCFGECLGRPLPWESETAKPFLEQLKQVADIKNGELFVSGCQVCPMKASCKALCPQIENFLEKNKKEETPKSLIEVSPSEEQLPETKIENLEQLPWEVLPKFKQQLIKEYISTGKDFKSLAEKFNLGNQARAKYEFYSGLTKLSEYASVRKFLKGNAHRLTQAQLKVMEYVYVDNIPVHVVSSILGTSKQNVSNIISRVFKKFNIKVNKFVFKKGDKLYYRVPEVLK